MAGRRVSVCLGAAVLLVLATAAAGPARAQQQSAPNIAVIDVTRLIQESAPGKAMLAQLEEFGKQQRSKLDAMKAEIDELKSRMEEGQLSLSEERLAELQEQYQDKVVDLRRASDDAQREFNQRQQRAFAGMERQLMPIIQQVGAEGGYTMIFNKFESGLVYAVDEIDITPEVIRRVDAAQAEASGG